MHIGNRGIAARVIKERSEMSGRVGGRKSKVRRARRPIEIGENWSNPRWQVPEIQGLSTIEKFAILRGKMPVPPE